MNIDVNGTLLIDVEEVDKVNRVIVTEPKSKFCKVFYTDPIPETRFTPSEEYVKPKADTYVKSVWLWLLNYQVRAAGLYGKYSPYEVLSWVANDWRREHETD